MKNNIYHIIVSLILLLGAVSVASAANSFYLKSVNIEPGETIDLNFILDNEQEFFGFQFDVALSEGLAFAQSNGNAVITLSSRADGSGYNLVSNLISDNSLRLGAFSISHKPFAGNAGDLLSIKVMADNDFKGGVISLTNIRFIDSDDKDVTLPDFSLAIGNQKNNSFFIENFSIYAGETKKVSVILDNETPFCAFQTDLYLPAELSAVPDSFRLSSRAGSSHSISTQSFDNGRIRIVCLSLAGDNFTGDSGVLLEFDITASKDAASESLIYLKNQIFSTSNAKEYYLSDDSAEISALHAMIEEILLSHSSVNMIIGETETLSASVLPEYAYNKELIWNSDNTEVAITDSDGKITAIGAGEAIITASSADGSDIIASCIVTVSIPTGVDESYLVSGCNVYVKDGVLYVTGVSEDECVEVYSFDGVCIYAGAKHIVPLQKGTYIVKVNSLTKKVII